MFVNFRVIYQLPQGSKLRQNIKIRDELPRSLNAKAYRVCSREILSNTYSYVFELLFPTIGL